MVTVTASTLSMNDAFLGGAIYNRSATATISATTLSANAAVREGGAIYNQFDGTVVLVGSTLEGNSAQTDGGGIYNLSTAVLIRSTLSDNTASGDGGGIYSAADPLAGPTANAASFTVNGGTLSSNSADRYGGAIYNGDGGTATISDSTLDANTADVHGGGIYNAADATATLSESTLKANTARVHGGGIANYGTATIATGTLSANIAHHHAGGIFNFGDLSVTNSTLSANMADSIGGAVMSSGDLTMRHSTVTGNRSDADGNGFGPGGGLVLFRTAMLEHTIVAGNFFGTAPTVIPSDIQTSYGVLTAASSFNLIGDPNSAGGLVHGTNGNIVGDGLGNPLDVNTVLDTTLADNGGPTLTHGLVMNSPALDAGDTDFLPPPIFDQRGLFFDRLVGERIDIGAYEMQMGGGDAPVHQLAVGTVSPFAGQLPPSRQGFQGMRRPSANGTDHRSQMAPAAMDSPTHGQPVIEAAGRRNRSPSPPLLAVDLALVQLADEVANEVAPLEADVEIAFVV